MLSKSFVLFGLISSISALAVNNNPPEPTAAPAFGGNGDLRRRQASEESARTLLAAPDNTCGYFGGVSSQPWGCSTGSTCVFATATSPAANSTQTQAAAGSVLCCAGGKCPTAPAPTACVDKGRNDYNKLCTGNCPSDRMTLKCTSGIYVFCNTITFPSPSISGLFCNYLSTYDALPAETTFAGQARAFTPTVLALAASTPSPIPSSSTSTTAKSTSITPTTKSTASSSPTAASTTGSLSPKKKLNKGAIIGGTIGGVAGIALLAAAIIFFLRWRNGKTEEKAPVAELGGTGSGKDTTPTPSVNEERASSPKHLSPASAANRASPVSTEGSRASGEPVRK